MLSINTTAINRNEFILNIFAALIQLLQFLCENVNHIKEINKFYHQTVSYYQ